MIDVEEARLAQVSPALRSRYDEVLAQGDGGLLWARAAADVQNGHYDDRALYWARLQLRALLRETGGDGVAAERAARGFDGSFRSPEPRVLLTGFDPFQLDRNVGQSNPSGLAALALDDTLVAGARIRTAILPVSYAAFDDGVVEQLLAPHFTAGLRVLLTVSMGRDGFDLERFPGFDVRPKHRTTATSRAADRRRPRRCRPGLQVPSSSSSRCPRQPWQRRRGVGRFATIGGSSAWSGVR